MKIDVEGAEENVLRGAAEIIQRDNPIIFCEIYPISNGWQTIPGFLTNIGYLIAAIHSNNLVVQKNKEPDPTTANYILYPKDFEPLIRKIAHSINLHYHS